MQPVLEGLLKYESLIDGSIDICDVALLNDALAVRAENERLAREVTKSNGH